MKCCDMHAGMLREPVTFQEMARLSDGAGGFTQTWSTISGAPDRAHVKAMSGGERYASARTEASASWRIVCRYNANIDETKKAIIRGRSYQFRNEYNQECIMRKIKINDRR